MRRNGPKIATALLMIAMLTGAAQAACLDKIPEGFKCKGKDAVVHSASGTAFPKQLAGFTRLYEQSLDLSGQEAAIGYRRETPAGPIVVRVALLHIEAMTPKEHYLGMKSLVGAYFQTIKFTDIKPAGEGPFDPPGMKQGSGYQGRFRATSDGKPFELSLSTVSYGYWSARLTAAYPSEDAAVSRAAVLDLAKKLQKTGPAKAKGKKSR